MFFDRCWSRATKFPFNAFGEILVPYYQMSNSCFLDRYWSHIKDSQEFIRRINGICQPPSFRKIMLFLRNKNLRFLESYCFNNDTVLSGIIWSHLVLPELEIIVFGNGGHVKHPKVMKMGVCGGFAKWSGKVTSPKWSRILLRSFWATLLLEFEVKMAPQTPSRPQIRTLHRFS